MILETKIINSKRDIELKVDNRTKDVRYIYLDTFENHNNYLSPNDNKHSFKFLAGDILVDKTNTTSTYNINRELLVPEKTISGLYIMTVFFDNGTLEHRIVFDLNELYCIRVKYLTSCCDNCSDTANYRGLTVLMFREMLLRNAITLNMIEAALGYYKDIYRPFCKGNSSIGQCSSGICKLC